jgi:hypothetical protein
MEAIMRLHRYIILLSIFILFSFSAYSQVIIDSNEYNVTIGSKHILYYVTESTGAGIAINLGTKGGPQSWSFSLDIFPGGATNEYTTVDHFN